MRERFERKVAVFPTRVGVNRHSPTRRICGSCIPHACGGEPPSSRKTLR